MIIQAIKHCALSDDCSNCPLHDDSKVYCEDICDLTLGFTEALIKEIFELEVKAKIKELEMEGEGKMNEYEKERFEELKNDLVEELNEIKNDVWQTMNTDLSDLDEHIRKLEIRVEKFIERVEESEVEEE